MHRSHRFGVPAACAAVAGFILLLPAGPAVAQHVEIPTREEQDQMYADIHDDYLSLQRQLSLLKKVVRLVRPTVVHVEAAKTQQLSFGSRGVEEAGSGVIIQLNERFYVLTNRHVIKEAASEKIRIKLADGREVHPLKIWSDRGTDVAVMQIAARGIIPVRLGDSNRMEIGDFVVAVGSPFGLSHSVTFGIVSAKGRRDLELGDDGVRFQDFIQTDAAINPGNSGGPLLNLKGELVGINTAIASSSGGNEGIGFAIPINMAMVVARQLIEHGTVARAFLGVNLDSKFGASIASRLGLPRPYGARITGIVEDSPAEMAELQVDDIILNFGGVRVEDDNHLVNLVGLTEVGAEVPVVIFRNRKPVKMVVKVGDHSTFRPE